MADDKPIKLHPSGPSPAQAREQARLHPLPWHWRTLLAAPHRLAFFAAALVMSASAVWWAIELVGRALGGASLATAVPATFVHAVVMSLGFMPLFFCGFLFTAGPKWLKQPEVSARQILMPVLAMVLGWMTLLLGASLHHGLAAVGVGLAAAGWGALTWRFGRMVRNSRVPDRLHAKVVGAASAVGVVLMGVVAIGLASQWYAGVRLAALLALWCFIVPVYLSVAHRMIPFFSASALPALDAWRPFWLLWTLLGAAALQGLWILAGALGVATLPGLLWVRALTSAAAGLAVLALAVRWGLMQSLRIRLLAMLHIGFVWLGVALSLDAVAVVWQQAGNPGASLLPLHALTMGFLASVLVAMATRVSCGHSGRTLAADNLAWGLFWGLQVATVLRLLAILWPAASPYLLAGGAVTWCLVLGGWSLRYGRWFGQARVDGRPG